MKFPDWDIKLLTALGAPPNPSRLAFLRAWQACEGGTARHNPLNTTYIVNGSTLYNHAGVRNYADPLMGLAATLLTLRLPMYSAIRQALVTPGLTAVAIARKSESGLGTWGTGSACILRQLGAHKL